MRQAGHVRVCGDADCGAQHFPRTDPAVIMLVSRGDRVVLGRKSEWPEHMYSTLAGFVEPGESLEDAVAREVWEEVRIEVADVGARTANHISLRIPPLELAEIDRLADRQGVTRTDWILRVIRNQLQTTRRR